jgi:Tat protein secretion system quality control protein TatD with DNase activity
MQKRAGIRNFNTLLEKGPGYSDCFVLEFAVACYSSHVPPVSQLQNPDSRLRFTFGLHPKEVFKYDSTRVTQVLRAAETAPYSVGLGEIGLDYTGTS